MGSIDDFSELCRLCLVKDQVNIPIFDETSDIGQTFLKIESCLPVKVSRDDNLPKKICDGCSYKLDMLYIFRNTSIDSEKQLISWLSQAGLSTTSKDPLATTTKPEIMVKQETFEPSDTRVDGDSSDLGVDAHSYMMQQQQLPYQQDFDFGEPSSSAARLSDEPSPKRAKRAAALKKAPIEETEEDEEEDLDAAMQITKAEDEDSEDADQPDYVEAPSTSADDQPGPSGVGKGAVEAPSIQSFYACAICFKVFHEEQKYLRHSHRHEERKRNPFYCTVCGYATEKKTDLREHTIITHSKDYPHKCDLCEEGYMKIPDLRHHRKMTHEAFSCAECSKMFYGEKKYQRHLRTHEKKNIQTFSCNLCSYKSNAKSSVRIHTINAHTRDFPFPCDSCKKGFVRLHSLELHRITAHDDVRFICELCKKVFKSLSSYNYHVKRHDPEYKEKMYQCKVCRMQFKGKYSHDKHKKTHYSQTFVCDICGKVQITLKGMLVHKRTHTGEKNFVCSECGKAFAEKMALVRHNTIHSGEKPYQCNVCNKHFARAGARSLHMKRVHLGEKPLKCVICSRAFAYKRSLVRHRCEPTR